jgi:hypothetical protein
MQGLGLAKQADRHRVVGHRVAVRAVDSSHEQLRVADQAVRRPAAVDPAEIASAVGDFIHRLRQLGVTVEDVLVRLQSTAITPADT